MASRAGLHVSIPGDILIVVHEFVARSEDELTLRRGERIKLIERDDEFGDGWYLGQHMKTGKSGLFPEVYTTAADKLAAKAPIGGLGPVVNHDEKHDSGFSSRSASAEQPPRPQPVESTSPTVQVAVPSTSASAFAQRKAAGNGRSVSHSLSSPVMNETLSVIEEHITDMNTPRQSYLNKKNEDNAKKDNDFGASPYNRLSYINGHETDEEDTAQFAEKEVRAWTPAQVAEHLETLGADRSHCQVFQEQEISGDLLLDMDRGTVLLREFDLGTLGRRLALFQKIQKFQNDIKGPLQQQKPAMSMTSTSESVRDEVIGASADLPVVAGLTTNPVPDQDASNAARKRSSTHGGLQADSSRQTHMSRLSASSVRSVPSHRRHSSVDVSSAPNTPRQTSHGSATWHTKQKSADAAWGTTGSGAHSAGILDTPSHYGSPWSPGLESPQPVIINSPEYRSLSGNAIDLDRGYSSNAENDGRKFKNLLRKRDSNGHSRAPSEQVSSKRLSGVFKHIRSSSSETPGKQDDASSMLTADTTPTLEKTSPLFSRASRRTSSKGKATGLRAISDAVTNNEKSTIGKHSALASISTDLQSPKSVGSSNQSITSTGKSVSFEEPNHTLGSTAKLASLPSNPSISRRKAKHETSAYTRGLEKKSPAEQIAGADYSGWMKKKSKSLGKWHPRLFVLRGRRLSYYYSEDDTEEKGLIDISFHRVLPANKDLITGFHATLRAGSGPVSPEGATLQTAAQIDAQSANKDGSDSGIFIFKLVPPRPGLSKAVNFTLPKVHFFAAASLQEGRNWMAALMKATIERDELKPITSTYKEKVMSLSRAKELRVRPPELAPDDETTAGQTGLGISGAQDSETKEADKEKISDGWSVVNSTTSEVSKDTLVA